MKINVEKISEVERKLNIEVPWEKYQSEIEQQFSLIRKSATIKGFRKGKAPVGMVRRVYGEEAHKDTVNALASEAMKDAMAQHDLKPFGNPYLTDVKTEENKAVIMEAMIELEPVFDLSEYSGMELEKTVPEASEEEITTLLERLRENRGESVELKEDRGLKQDDIAVIDYAGSKGGSPLEELNAKDFLVRVGRSELVPGFEEQILGMKNGQTREFDLTFPDDFVHKDLAGELIHFTVTLKGIRTLQLPEVDDEFAKSFKKFETVDDLMAGIQGDILKTKEEDSSRELRGNLARRLVEDNVFDVPPSMADRELRSLVQDYGENLQNAGMSNEKIHEMILKNEDNLKKTAEEQIRLLYVVGEIAEKEDIKADAEEIRNAVNKRAQAAGRDAEDLMKEYAENGTLADIGFSIARDKVFGLVLERAKIKEVKAGAGRKEKKGKQEKKVKGTKE